MQFYLNGYQPGDPHSCPAAPGAEDRPAGLPDTVDVLIVGGGPAGSVLAAQLSISPGIRTRLIERRDGPLKLGQADGVACRTVEMFEATGTTVITPCPVRAALRFAVALLTTMAGRVRAAWDPTGGSRSTSTT